jgi:hypothetical protein
MRKLLVGSSLALAVAVAVPLALAATSGRVGGQLDRQRATWKTSPISTSSTAWRTIPRLSFAASGTANHTLCARHALSVALRVDLRGAPVRFRVLMDGGPTLQPGPARFVPSADSRTFLATFVGSAGTFEASDRHALEVQWRSPSEGQVTLDGGVANVLFEQGASC